MISKASTAEGLCIPNSWCDDINLKVQTGVQRRRNDDAHTQTRTHKHTQHEDTGGVFVQHSTAGTRISRASEGPPGGRKFGGWFVNSLRLPSVAAELMDFRARRSYIGDAGKLDAHGNRTYEVCESFFSVQVLKMESAELVFREARTAPTILGSEGMKISFRRGNFRVGIGGGATQATELFSENTFGHPNSLLKPNESQAPRIAQNDWLITLSWLLRMVQR